MRGCNGQDIRGSRVRVEMAKNRGGGSAGPRLVGSTGPCDVYYNCNRPSHISRDCFERRNSNNGAGRRANDYY